MRRFKSSILVMAMIAICSMLLFTSCEKDDDDEKVVAESQFVSKESPYLICAGRNPGGMGFDFDYHGKKGGANNMDSLSVSDFKYDLKIRTIKGEKGDGSLGGAPFVQLNSTVEAVNYSTVDITCTGIEKFNALNATNVKSYTLSIDDVAFDIESVTKGGTGLHQ